MAGAQAKPPAHGLPDDEFKTRWREAFVEFMSNPLDHPEEFRSWIPGYVELNPPTLPISQITGFDAFTVQTAVSVTASESTASTSYADLATVGPQFTSLANGTYLFIYGCLLNEGTNLGDTNYVSLSVNGSTPSDLYAGLNYTSFAQPVVNSVTATLTAGQNAAKLQYRTTNGANTVVAANRWLVAIKSANL